MDDFELTPEREKELEEASVLKAKADNLAKRMREAYEEAKTLCPPPYWESRRKKDTYERVLARLSGAYHRVSNLQSRYREQDRRKKEQADKEAQEARDKTAAEEKIKFRDRAILWLTEKGKKLGTDFTSEDAIHTADELAFELECARCNASDEPIDFDGQNCDGPCAGWVPGDHRCECGNRRVSWSAGCGHTFESPHIYAEAY